MQAFKHDAMQALTKMYGPCDEHGYQTDSLGKWASHHRYEHGDGNKSGSGEEDTDREKAAFNTSPQTASDLSASNLGTQNAGRPYLQWQQAEKISMVGGNGSGKTTALEAMAEHLAHSGAYVVVVDCAGAISRHLAGGNRRGDGYFEGGGSERRWGRAEIDTPIRDREHAVQLLAKMEEKHGNRIKLLDLSPLLADEKKQSADAIAEAIRQTQDGALFIDEIHEICPQKGGSAREMERMIRMSGNIGWWPICWTTQRPQYADKDVLALGQMHMVGRLDNARDAQYLATSVVGSDDMAEALEQETGEFLIRGCDSARVKLELSSGEMVTR